LKGIVVLLGWSEAIAVLHIWEARVAWEGVIEQ